MRIGFQLALESHSARSVEGMDGGREAFQERQPSATMGGEVGGWNAASFPLFVLSLLFEKDDGSSAEQHRVWQQVKHSSGNPLDFSNKTDGPG